MTSWTRACTETLTCIGARPGLFRSLDAHGRSRPARVPPGARRLWDLSRSMLPVRWVWADGVYRGPLQAEMEEEPGFVFECSGVADLLH